MNDAGTDDTGLDDVGRTSSILSQRIAPGWPAKEERTDPVLFIGPDRSATRGHRRRLSFNIAVVGYHAAER
jgi:hypothetical protein